MRKFLDGSEHLFLDQNFGHLKVLSREHMNAVVMNPSQVCLSKRKDKHGNFGGKLPLSIYIYLSLSYIYIYIYIYI